MDQLGFRPISSHPITKVNPKNNPLQDTRTLFKQHFQQAVESTNRKLAISKHAQLRMNQRNIDINSTTWSKIEAQIQQAQKMGVTDSLVLTKEAALVVSAKNNTVITAMGRDEASSQIFTNINGTILIDE